MNILKQVLIFVLVFYPLFLQGQTGIPRPTKAQLAWHDMEFYLFMHFGPNTFTDLEWGHGNEKEEVFNPTNLDCEQWCRIAKAAGAKAIIITAKHHDGFCLWPSKFSKHTVRESKWKDGKGDVLKELSAACKKYGLKFGVYISPWDRNHPDYGTEKYNDVFVNMMKEVLTNYGPVWELWWDGANGEGPNGKRQVYDWKRFEKTVRELSPNTVVFSDIGPDIRWVGNEQGFAGKTNWNTLDTAGFTRGAGGPPQDTLNSGNVNGQHWIPAECDVSIRPGWFYHKAEDSKVKTAEQLFDLYLKSVGRGANLLLNVPPDGRGLINENDSAALVGFEKLRKKNFKKNLTKNSFVETNYGHALFHTTKLTDNNIQTTETFKLPGDDIKVVGDEGIRISFKTATDINCISINESLVNGQRVKAFEIVLLDENIKVLSRIVKTTIGRKLIITFQTQKVKTINIRFIDAKSNSIINEVAAYLIDEKLIEK
jgi:alpha-L-fucosidase